MATLNIKNFPDRLHRRIKRRAAGNHRSLAQEVVHLLDEATAEMPRLSLLELDGLGKDLWDQELSGRDASDFIAEERKTWS